MNKFLCFGAHDGTIVSKIDLATKSGIYGENMHWQEIHLFEPQKYHEASLKAICNMDNRCRYHKVAVSYKDGIENLYLRGNIGQIGSSLDKNKLTGNLIGKEEVTCINIVDWILKNTSVDDFVVVDMDIECEEYNVLLKIMDSDISDRIKYLSVEFHNGKSSVWTVGDLDAKIEEKTKQFFGNRFIDHNTHFA